MIPVETNWLHFLGRFSLYQKGKKDTDRFPMDIIQKPKQFTTSTAILNSAFYPFQSFNLQKPKASGSAWQSGRGHDCSGQFIAAKCGPF